MASKTNGEYLNRSIHIGKHVKQSRQGALRSKPAFQKLSSRLRRHALGPANVKSSPGGRAIFLLRMTSPNPSAWLTSPMHSASHRSGAVSKRFRGARARPGCIVSLQSRTMGAKSSKKSFREPASTRSPNEAIWHLPTRVWHFVDANWQPTAMAARPLGLW